MLMAEKIGCSWVMKGLATQQHFFIAFFKHAE
jgi:hypothetical protein